MRPAAHTAKFLSLVQVVLALPQPLFGLLALDNLEFQILIRPSQGLRSLRDSHFEFVSGSRNPGHEQCKGQKHQIVKNSRHRTYFRFEVIAANNQGEQGCEYAGQGAAVPIRDRDCGQRKCGKRLRQMKI